MKYTKQDPGASAKPKVKLSIKNKFKRKNTGDSNGHVEKGAKIAADLFKKGSLDQEVKGKIKGAKGFKTQEKKPTKKPGKLTPEVKLGLELDQLLETKAQKKQANSSEDTPVKTSPGKRSASDLSSSQNEASPESKRRRAKKKRGEQENDIQSNLVTDVFHMKENSASGIAQNEASPKSKRRAKKKRGEQENDIQSNLVTNVFHTKENSASGIAQNEASPKSKRRAKKKRGEQENVASDIASVTNIKKAAAKEVKPSVSANLKAISNVDSKMESEYGLVSKDVLKAVKCLLEQFKNNNKSKNLLDSETGSIFLKFCFYIPHNKQKVIRFQLPHTLVTDTSDICLIVPDVSKKSVEDSQSFWEQKLRDNNLTYITEVIPYKRLLTEYSQFQDKRKLSNRFDFFLVDGKLAHRTAGFLGKKFFHSQRKIPMPVKLDVPNIEKPIKIALSKTVSHYEAAALNFSIQVGHTGMADKEIQNNIMEVWKNYPQEFGVYWDNVKAASIFIDKIPELPLFYSLSPPENAMPTIYKNMEWTKESNKPIVGQLSTAMDKNVLVYPSGKVTVQSAPKPETTEENILTKSQKKKLKMKQNKLRKLQAKSEEDEAKEQLASDDDIGGRRDMLVNDSDEELEFEESSSDEESPVKNKSSDKGKANTLTKVEKVKGKNANKQKNKIDEDSDLVDKAEEMYLKNLASLKNKSSKAVAAKKPKSADSDEESVDSDSESDEELIDLENPWGGEESLEETETDEDIPTLVPAVKQNKFKKGGNMKSGKNVNGAAAIKKKTQKKPGSGKGSPKSEPISKKLPKKKTLEKPGSGKGSPKSERISKKPMTEQQNNKSKKTPEKSFQGVKADQKKGKSKKPDHSIKKKIAKKFSK